MWNSSAFGNFGNTGFDQPAGGFLNTTNNFASPSPQEKKRPERFSNVVPCTVAQVLQVPETEEHLKIGSMDAHIITVVGAVRAIDAQSTRITYLIDDLTGPPLEVQLWTGENADFNRELANIKENIYIRVTGALRSMKGKRLVIAFKIRPVEDANEISMHLLEVMHTSMSVAVMDKQNISQAGAQFLGSSSIRGAPGVNNAMETSFEKDSGFMMTGLTNAQQIVLNTITSCRDEEGMSIFGLFNNLKSLGRTTISEAVEFLSNEGHIYSTIDDDHYKSTDSG